MKKLVLACALIVSSNALRAQINNPTIQAVTQVIFPQKFTLPAMLSLSYSIGFAGLYIAGYSNLLTGDNLDLSAFLNFISLWPLTAVVTSLAVQGVPPSISPYSVPANTFIAASLYALWFDVFKEEFGIERAVTALSLLVSSYLYSINLAIKKEQCQLN